MLSIKGQDPNFYLFEYDLFYKIEKSKFKNFFDSSNDELVKIKLVQLDKNVKLKNGFAHTITDVNGDYKSDLVLVGRDIDEKIIFYVLQLNELTNKYEKTDSYSGPNDLYVYGQSLFGDFDSDGEIEHLLPCCNDQECSKSFIFIRKLNKVKYFWICLKIYFRIKNKIKKIVQMNIIIFCRKKKLI